MPKTTTTGASVCLAVPRGPGLWAKVKSFFEDLFLFVKTTRQDRRKQKKEREKHKEKTEALAKASEAQVKLYELLDTLIDQGSYQWCHTSVHKERDKEANLSIEERIRNAKMYASLYMGASAYEFIIGENKRVFIGKDHFWSTDSVLDCFLSEALNKLLYEKLETLEATKEKIREIKQQEDQEAYVLKTLGETDA